MPPPFSQRPNQGYSPWGMPRAPRVPRVPRVPRQQNFMYYPTRQFQAQPARGRGGGFLARLFGRSQTQPIQSSINPFQFGAGIQQTGTQSSLRSMLNPESISRFLGQTQQVLRTAQQIGPMVQQYGPLIRNLPSLWKLYQGFKNSDVTDTEAEESEELDLENSSEVELEIEDENTINETAAEESVLNEKQTGYKSNPEKSSSTENATFDENNQNNRKQRYRELPSVPKFYI
ncbi:YqfQ family protein [Caldibacillus lycopersici]|uniref:YqfQ family protein n=1 Tax=Perspicuibacillus lycopersici TaxID=1325689 RepID=A0AAE3LQU9_9BACI|nr:YqfQ family protein [Perspicuibacillus lycopersici]MCU9613899.1 YqfQ family protein [Perspicuibacillus lycopersici]